MQVAHNQGRVAQLPKGFTPVDIYFDI